MTMEFVNAAKVESAGPSRLFLRFSNGAEGIHDFSEMLSETGPMIEPLQDETLFARDFVDCGAIAWPNGYDIDPTQLHKEMPEAGELSPVAA